ncbi:MAG: c-type cytochrome, partial [Flavobacteriales bacterium]|nr:c-type cytochrome [Flavobacteriales bacterium]
MTTPWQPSPTTIPRSVPRLFLRPVNRTVAPSKLLGMPLLARISERYTGLFHLSLALFLFLAAPAAFAQPDGKKLFTGNCASCHKVDKDFTGP